VAILPSGREVEDACRRIWKNASTSSKESVWEVNDGRVTEKGWQNLKGGLYKRTRKKGFTG